MIQPYSRQIARERARHPRRVVSADSRKNFSRSRFRRAHTNATVDAVATGRSDGAVYFKPAEGTMGAGAKVIGLNSRSIRINVNGHDDANFWARYLECTPEELLQAVSAVGSDQARVRARLALGREKAAEPAVSSRAIKDVA